MTMTDPTIRTFEVHVPDEDLADLKRRIAAVRWPSKELVADRSQGVQLATTQALVTYWTAGHDWRAWLAPACSCSPFRPCASGRGSSERNINTRCKATALPI